MSGRNFLMMLCFPGFISKRVVVRLASMTVEGFAPPCRIKVAIRFGQVVMVELGSFSASARAFAARSASYLEIIASNFFAK